MEDKREASFQYIITKIMSKKCLVCRGHGHYAKECPSKKKIDEQMKAVMQSCEWGAVKSSLMMNSYREFYQEYRNLMTEKFKRLHEDPDNSTEEAHPQFRPALPTSEPAPRSGTSTPVPEKSNIGNLPSE